MDRISLEIKLALLNTISISISIAFKDAVSVVVLLVVVDALVFACDALGVGLNLLPDLIEVAVFLARLVQELSPLLGLALGWLGVDQLHYERPAKLRWPTIRPTRESDALCTVSGESILVCTGG